MTKRRRTRPPPCPLRAQTYEPRVEVVIEALGHAVGGCRLLVEFLREQEGADWRQCGGLLRQADDELRQARLWLGKELRTRRHHSPVLRS